METRCVWVLTARAMMNIDIVHNMIDVSYLDCTEVWNTRWSSRTTGTLHLQKWRLCAVRLDTRCRRAEVLRESLVFDDVPTFKSRFACE